MGYSLLIYDYNMGQEQGDIHQILYRNSKYINNNGQNVPMHSQNRKQIQCSNGPPALR